MSVRLGSQPVSNWSDLGAAQALRAEANCIWKADIEGRTRAKTGVCQCPRREKGGGTVRIFVGDTKIPTEEKFRLEAESELSMAQATSSSA